MLCHDVTQNQAIVDQLRASHRDNRVAPKATMDIDYGWYKGRKGGIRVEKGQFAVVSTTRMVGAKEEWVPVPYTHEFGDTLTLKKIEEALGSSDLAKDGKSRTIAILMTSECARSEVVNRFFAAFLNQKLMDDHDFMTIKTLVNSYNATLKKAGKSIDPGPNWQPLNFDDCRAYLADQQDKTKLTYLEEMWKKIAGH